MTTPVLSSRASATLSSTLPTLVAGDAGTYLFYKGATPRTAGLNGDTANDNDLIVWTGTQWRVQPRLGTYTTLACGDFFTALTDCWFNGVQLKAGESIVFMGQLGSGGRLRYIRAKTDTGQFVFRGAFAPSGGLPATPRQGDCWIASAAGTASGLTFAEGDWLIRDAGLWSQIAGEQRTTVASGAYVSLRCAADCAEWEVRRVDKSATRCSITLSTLQQTSPNTRWPWQTWTEEAGRMIVGYDAAQTEFNAIGKLGGGKTSAIAVANLPTTAMANFTVADVPIAHDGSTEDDQTLNKSSIVRGGGTPLPILSPYRVKHIWRRTA